METLYKILITGATGFVGGRLTRRLASLPGYQVLATGRNAQKGQALQAQGIHFVSGDLSKADFARELVKGQHGVVHCAGLSAPWGAYSQFYQANVLSTQHLLQAAQQEGIHRFVQISSPSIYASYKHLTNIKEDYLPTKFVNHYAQTKYEADQLIHAAVVKDFPAIILRPRAIIGAGDLTIMPRILRAHEQGRLKIIGSGDNIADLTSVSNLCDAIELALHTQQQEAIGQIYNISNGKPVQLWELIPQVLQKLGREWRERHLPYWLASTAARLMEGWSRLQGGHKEPVLTRYGIASIYFSMTLNIEKAKKILHYQPKQSTEEAIEEFATWWQKGE